MYIGARWPSEAGAWSGRGAASERRAARWHPSGEPHCKLNVYFWLCTQERGGLGKAGAWIEGEAAWECRATGWRPAGEPHCKLNVCFGGVRMSEAAR